MKRPRRRYPALIGMAMVLGGFAYDLMFAGLPYPDPTPEQQARWAFHQTVADWIMLAGLGLLLSSLGAALVLWLIRFRPGRR